MKLINLINKSIYGTTGYISCLEDVNLLEQYILYNLPILKEFKQIITATTYKESNKELYQNLVETWRKYFWNSIHLDNGISRGHSFGAADNDDSLFNYCKQNNIKWLCKSANDMIFEKDIFDKNIEEADFYYLNGIGYGGMVKYNFDFEDIIKKDFYPQTNFYILNVDKIDYLNDKKHVDETYNYIKTLKNYSGRAWEYGFRSCETLLKETVDRNNLTKYHLIPKHIYTQLLQIIKDYNIHDCSHKNIMIDGICHYHENNQQIIEI